ELITRPHVVEKSFSEFFSDYEFTTELEELLKQVQPKAEQVQSGSTGLETTTQPFRDLTIISVSYTGYEGRQAKNLLKAIGQGIKEWIDVHTEPANAKLYCIYGERFYILLKNVNSAQARNHARRLYTRLREYIQRDKQIARYLDDIYLHIGVVGHSYMALQEMLANKSNVATLRGTLTLRLDNALTQGKEEEEDSIFVWHPQKEDFICIDVLSDQDTAGSVQTKELVRQIIEEEFLQQIIEEVHNRQEE
ncbi:MAG: hypothetical protein JOZ18_00610, partial [Chloroflexi bacterium]|nr:hypothetical protein [Chloroflexota bacterium]